MSFDVLWMDDIIAHVELKPANGGTPYVINYIDDFNKQFSPTMEGHISLEELERWLKWRTFPLLGSMPKNYWLHWKCKPIIVGASCVKLMVSWQMTKFGYVLKAKPSHIGMSAYEKSYTILRNQIFESFNKLNHLNAITTYRII